MTVRILQGHVLDRIADLADESVHCVVTSPPYWGLRDYGTEPQVWGGEVGCDHKWADLIAVNATNHTDKRRWQHTRNGRDEEQPTEKRVAWLRTKVPQGQFCENCGAWAGSLGLEPDYALYVAHIVEIFEAIKRVLRADGVAWLNLGDCYATGAGKVGEHPGGGEQGKRWAGRGVHTPKNSGKAAPRIAAMGPLTQPNRMPQQGLKAKDLVGIPWRVAFALQEAGWWLRKDNIFHKRNPMPESVEDRTTTSHEYVFHLTTAERYWYDAAAIMEPFETDPRENYPGRARSTGRGEQGFALARGNDRDKSGGFPVSRGGRNRRSVWTISTSPTPDAHFATMPEEIAEICILAGCPIGGTVLDPFLGSGTTARVADRLARDCIGIELQPKYVAIAERRTREPGFSLECLTPAT